MAVERFPLLTRGRSISYTCCTCFSWNSGAVVIKGSWLEDVGYVVNLYHVYINSVNDEEISETWWRPSWWWGRSCTCLTLQEVTTGNGVAGVLALQATRDLLRLTCRPLDRNQMQEHCRTRAGDRNLDMIQTEVGNSRAERYPLRRQDQSWEIQAKVGSAHGVKESIQQTGLDLGIQPKLIKVRN